MDLAVNLISGGSLVELPPVFSIDGESIFVCSKNTILEYNTRTGKLCHEYKGFSDPIIGFNCHFYDNHHCLTACSVSGKLVSWKTLTHFKISEKQLGNKKMKTFNIISMDDKDYKAIVSYPRKKHIRFASVNIKEETVKEYKFVVKPEQEYFIRLSKEYFSVAQNNVIYFIKMSQEGKLERYSMNASRTFTCLACHPSEEIVLSGDSSGRVIVWQNIFLKEKTQAVFHWHTLPVQTVSFSSSPSYFYSGGSECVLVKWQLENVDNRRYIPRIAAEIEHVVVACDGLYVAVATRDNAIRIFDTTLNQISTIQHLVLGQHYDSGIIYDPRTRALIMNGNQGQIQFFSPDDMSLMYSIDIVGQNKVTNERNCVMNNTEITKVAISKTGFWLATVEERKDLEFLNEIRLKFWKFDEEKQRFQLNTSVEYPHDDSINAMQFQPVHSDDNLRCITVGNDKKFKVWQIVDCSTVHKKSIAWECHAARSYFDYSCSSLSLSEDGSLLATGFGSALTIWISESFKFEHSFSHPFDETIKQVQFGSGNQGHLVVSASANQLSVWNILTDLLMWTVPMSVSFLIADRFSEKMAVLSQNNEGISVFIYSLSSNVPVYSSSDLLKDVGEVMAAGYVGRSQMYLISSKRELYCVTSDKSNHYVPENTEETNSSLFKMAMPVSKLSLASSTIKSKHLYQKDPSQKTIKKYLEGPIHTMAPVRFFCSSFLKSLVIQK